MSRSRTDVIFILIGVLPIAVAYHLHPEGLGPELLRDFGVVIVSLAIIDLLWQLVGGEPLSNEIEQMRNLNLLTRQAHENGLVDFGWKRTALTNDGVLSDISVARNEIDLCGHTLFAMIENRRFLDELMEQVKRKIRVRVLVCAPDNPALRSNVSPELFEATIGLMVTSWTAFQAEYQKLPVQDRDYLEIRRLRRCALLSSIARFDDHLYTIGYLNSRNTNESPILAIKGVDKPLYVTYSEEFNYCFELAENS